MFIETKKLSKSYLYDTVIHDISVAIQEHEVVGLLGPGGSGKTVLLKLLCSLIPASAGEVWIAGKNITRLNSIDLGEIRRLFGMVFQNNALFDSLSVFDNVAFPLVQEGRFSERDIRDRVLECLSGLGLANVESLKPSEISGGMKKRVGIARAIVHQPRIIFFDDPTAGLDPVTSSKIYELIQGILAKRPTTIIISSHDISAMSQFCKSFLMLHHGECIFSGTSQAFFQTDQPIVKQFISGSLSGPL